MSGYLKLAILWVPKMIRTKIVVVGFTCFFSGLGSILAAEDDTDVYCPGGETCGCYPDGQPPEDGCVPPDPPDEDPPEEDPVPPKPEDASDASICFLDLNDRDDGCQVYSFDGYAARLPPVTTRRDQQLLSNQCVIDLDLKLPGCQFFDDSAGSIVVQPYNPDPDAGDECLFDLNHEQPGCQSYDDASPLVLLMPFSPKAVRPESCETSLDPTSEACFVFNSNAPIIVFDPRRPLSPDKCSVDVRPDMAGCQILGIDGLTVNIQTGNF